MDPATLDALIRAATVVHRVLPLLHATGDITDAQMQRFAQAGQGSDRAFDSYHREIRGLPDAAIDDHLRPELAHAAFELAARLTTSAAPRASTSPSSSTAHRG